MELNGLCILSGAPASGKSTWAKEYIKEHSEVVYVSRDNVREELVRLKDGYFSAENVVFEEFSKEIFKALEEGKTVLADATHINWYSVRKLLNKLNWSDKYTIIRFEVPFRELIARNMNRTGFARVPEKVIRKMYHSMDDPNKYCKNVIVIKN